MYLSPNLTESIFTHIKTVFSRLYIDEMLWNILVLINDLSRNPFRYSVM